MSISQLSKESEALRQDADPDADAMEQVVQHVTRGRMGTYQWALFIMMLPIGVLYSFLYGVQMFVTATPDQHWCKVPELMHLDVQLRRNLSIPGAWEGASWERCRVYDANWTLVALQGRPPPSDTPTLPCSHGWEFLFDDIPYPTVVTEREWVCDRASYGPWAQALFFVGSLAGGALFGWMGDRFGRVPALIAANVAGAVGGTLSAFTVGLWDFIACRFVAGMANDACFGMMYIILLEYVGARHRSWAGNVSLALYCGAGGALLPWVALQLADWRRLLLVTSLPMLVTLLAPLLVPESARWLASTGRVNEAVKVLRKFERVNKAKIPDDILQKFISQSKQSEEGDSGVLATIRGGLGPALAALLAATVAASIVIDAIIRLSASIGDSLFVTYALSSLVELPALALLAVLLDRLGRRFLSVWTLWAAGALSLVGACVPRGWPQLWAALGARFAVNMSVGAVMQLGAEVLPTSVRARGLAILHMAVFLATALSPFLVYSGALWAPLPLVLTAAVAAVGGASALLLPETRGQDMPHTLRDALHIVRDTALSNCMRPEIDEPEVIYLENKNVKPLIN